MGVTRERALNAGSHQQFARTAYSLGTAYTFNGTTVGVDLERAETNDQGFAGNKRTQAEVRSVLKQKLTPNWFGYTMYAYKTNKLSSTETPMRKNRTHQYMLGTEYYLVPASLVPTYLTQIKGFVEVATSRTKHHTEGKKQRKSRDNAVAVGVRISW